MHKMKDLELEGVMHLRPKVHSDNRGFFFEFSKESQNKKLGIPKFVQDNISFSNENVLRGLHFQKPPYEQGKLVIVLDGQILDVVVDIRHNSPTLGDYNSIILDSQKQDILYVPEGFAHGFYTLSKSAKIYYKNTREYSPTHDSGIIWNDIDLNINWPCKNPILSEKDKEHMSFKEYLIDISEK